MSLQQQGLAPADVVRHYESGLTIAEIGQLVGRDPSTVYRALRAEGVTFRRRHGVAREEMPPAQAHILAFIKTYLRGHGYPPSVREITEASVTNSTATTVYHLQQLEERGRIRRAPGVARGITVLSETGASR